MANENFTSRMEELENLVKQYEQKGMAARQAESGYGAIGQGISDITRAFAKPRQTQAELMAGITPEDTSKDLAQSVSAPARLMAQDKVGEYQNLLSQYKPKMELAKLMQDYEQSQAAALAKAGEPAERLALKQKELEMETAAKKDLLAYGAGIKGEDKVDKELQFKQAKDIRSEVNSRATRMRDVESSYSKILGSGEKPSAAGDISLLTGYMKLIDPGSTVREGEFATAANAGSVPERVRAMYNKALSGERLSVTQRDDFINQAGGIYDKEKQIYDRDVQYYTDLGKEYGLDEKKIIPYRPKIKQKIITEPKKELSFFDKILNKQLSIPTAQAKSGPIIGTIEGGHKYLGGDPSKPESWEKQ